MILNLDISDLNSDVEEEFKSAKKKEDEYRKLKKLKEVELNYQLQLEVISITKP